MQDIPHVTLFNVEASAKLRELYLEVRFGFGGVTCCHFDLITMLLERKLKTSVAVQFFNLKLVQTQRREFDISRGWAQKLRQARVTATR
jgi:hypothetical protein